MQMSRRQLNNSSANKDGEANSLLSLQQTSNRANEQIQTHEDEGSKGQKDVNQDADKARNVTLAAKRATCHGIASLLSQNKAIRYNKTNKGFRVIAPSVDNMAMLAGLVVRHRTRALQSWRNSTEEQGR
jgi:hypothetical protein